MVRFLRIPPCMSLPQQETLVVVLCAPSELAQDTLVVAGMRSQVRIRDLASPKKIICERWNRMRAVTWALLDGSSLVSI